MNEICLSSFGLAAKTKGFDKMSCEAGFYRAGCMNNNIN